MIAPALLAALLGAAVAPGVQAQEGEARVTAERSEGEPVERSAFYHDDSGLEVFAWEEVTPVTVVVRLLDRTDWIASDIDDAEHQLATCEGGAVEGVTRTVRGRELTLTFGCVRPD